MFENAKGIFFLHKEMITYLEGCSTNRLLTAVLHDLKTKEFISGIKALALVSNFITEPFWRLTEDRTISIVDMCKHYKSLVEFFELSTDRVQDFICGDFVPFAENSRVKKDVLYQELIKPWVNDGIVCTILQVLFPAIGKLVQRLFADHLHDGKYAEENIDETLKTRLTGVPKTNKFSETVLVLWIIC